MVHYEAIIKEVGNDHILTPAYYGQRQTKQDLIELWGLESNIIEWYELFEMYENGEKIKM